MSRACARYGAICLVFLGFALGCSNPPTANPTAVAKSDAIIAIECNVAEAEVWVNDRFVAHVRGLRGGMGLSPGTHRIEFRHDHHHKHYEILTVQARERRSLTVEMAEKLP